MGFRLTASDLPEYPVTGPPAPVSEVADELGLPAPAWRFDLGAVAPGIAGQVGEVAPVVVDGEASPTDGAIAISLGTNAPAAAVVTDGKTFTPARNPASPQEGEFIQNPYTGEVVLYSQAAIAGLVAYVRDSSLVPYRTRLKLPPLTTGRESMVRRRVDVIPGPDARRTISQSIAPPGTVTGGGSTRRRKSSQPDRYTEFLSEMNGEGASYKDMVVKTTFTEHVGRPGSADRKATDYEPEPPEDSHAPATEAQDDNTLYIVTSPGYDPADEPRESTSYPYATTKAEAQAAVRTDAIVAEITNPSRSVNITVPINLQVRPGDRVQAMLSGVIYSCRVNQAVHQGQLLGLVEGSIEIEGRTQLTLSPDREPDFVWTERPAPVITGTGTGSLFVRRNALLYSNRLLSSIRTRRNF